MWDIYGRSFRSKAVYNYIVYEWKGQRFIKWNNKSTMWKCVWLVIQEWLTDPTNRMIKANNAEVEVKICDSLSSNITFHWQYLSTSTRVFVKKITKSH